MAQPVGGPWLRVGKLIELFTAMGCVLGELPGEIHGPRESWRVRYLYNPDPDVDRFVSLSDLSDDDILPPSEVENWERTLGVEIPKGEWH